MKSKLCAVLLSGVIVFPSFTQAASQDECAGWLCLPFGFAAPGCSGARKAVFKRLAKFKSPLPAFGSCSVDGNPTGLDVQRGSAILFSGVRRITLGGSCNHRDSGPEEPAGCLKTLYTYQVTEAGTPIGTIYVRDKSGPDYIYEPETGTFTRLR